MATAARFTIPTTRILNRALGLPGDRRLSAARRSSEADTPSPPTWKAWASSLRLTLNPPWVNAYQAVYDGNVQPGSTTDQGLSVLQTKNPFQGAALHMYDPNLQPARVQQWSTIIEHQLPWDMVLWAGYIGEKGTHLVDFMPYFQKILTPSGQVLPSPYVEGNPATGGDIAVSPGPGSAANMEYDSLQLSARKRLSKGLEFQLAYTWSKGMSRFGGFLRGRRTGKPTSNRSRCRTFTIARRSGGRAILMPRRCSASIASYELPFGHGQAMGSNWNPVVNGILGNWRVGAIVSAHTGFPITVTALDRSGTLSVGAARQLRGKFRGTAGSWAGRHLVQYRGVQATNGGNLRQLRRGDDERSGTERSGYVGGEGISYPGYHAPGVPHGILQHDQYANFPRA